MDCLIVMKVSLASLEKTRLLTKETKVMTELQIDAQQVIFLSPLLLSQPRRE